MHSQLQECCAAEVTNNHENDYAKNTHPHTLHTVCSMKQPPNGNRLPWQLQKYTAAVSDSYSQRGPWRPQSRSESPSARSHECLTWRRFAPSLTSARFVTTPVLAGLGVVNVPSTHCGNTHSLRMYVESVSC